MCAKKSKNRNGWKKLIIKLFFSGVLLVGIALFSFVILVKAGAFGPLPTYADLKKIKNNTATNIYSVDNKLLGRYYPLPAGEGIWIQYATLDQEKR